MQVDTCDRDVHILGVHGREHANHEVPRAARGAPSSGVFLHGRVKGVHGGLCIRDQGQRRDGDEVGHDNRHRGVSTSWLTNLRTSQAPGPCPVFTGDNYTLLWSTPGRGQYREGVAGSRHVAA